MLLKCAQVDDDIIFYKKILTCKYSPFLFQKLVHKDYITGKIDYFLMHELNVSVSIIIIIIYLNL